MKKVNSLILSAFLLTSCVNVHVHKYEVYSFSATCDQDGYDLHICKECGEQFSEKTNDKKNHSLTHFNEISATLTEDGQIEHFYCSECGKYFDKDMNEIYKQDTKTTKRFFNYKNSVNPIDYVQGDLSIEFTTTSFNNYVSDIHSFEAKITAGETNYKEIVNFKNDILDYKNYLNDQHLKALSVADMSGFTSDYTLEGTILNSINTISLEIENLTKIIAKSPYKHMFYPGKSDKEIDEIVESIENQGNEDVALANQQINEITNKYKTGELTDFQCVKSFVVASNKLAKLSGYENYLDYCYENVYSRNYKTSDTNALTDIYKNTIMPLYFKVIDKIDSLRVQADSNTQLRNSFEISDALSNNFFGKNYDLLENYAQYIGGLYENNFNSLFFSGELYLSSNRSNVTTAYTEVYSNDYPFMLMTRDYQGGSTFIHEFGHYNAFRTAPKCRNYDIQETHSQGNELLYANYLLNNKLIEENAAKLYLLSCLENLLFTPILMGYVVNEVEKYLFSSTSFTDRTIKSKINSVGNAIGINLSDLSNYDYVIYVIANMPGYFISYAVSALASLELLALSYEDFDKAKNSYISLYTEDEPNETFKKALENAGLCDVFDQNAYAKIGNIVNFVDSI